MSGYASGSYILVGALGTITADADANSAVTFNLTGLLSTYDIAANTGATVVINNTVDVANTLNLDTNGGTISIGTLAGALGPVNVTIDGGGSFMAGGTVLSLLQDGSITYGTGGGSIVLGTAPTVLSLNFTPVINGFTSGLDSIDDQAISFSGFTGFTISGNPATEQTVSISDSSGSFEFTVNAAGLTNGVYSGLSGGGLVLAADGSGGIDIHAPCFTPGTHIRTPAGEVTVEELRIGDLVQTHLRGAQMVKWIGTRAYDGRFIEDNHLLLPVTLAAGALADGVPARPLTVSAGHGIWLDGALMPAWRLVNGVTITQPRKVEKVEYFHIELAAHDLLLSEGCLSESYFDNGARAQFHNAGEYAALYPEPEQHAGPALPRVEAGFALAAARERINVRAGQAPVPEMGGGLRGFIDIVAPGYVAGWAQSAVQPEAPVTLEIMADGELVTLMLANAYRADLRSAGLGSGCHGFEFFLPDGVSGPVTVRRAMDGAALPLTVALQEERAAA